MAVFRQKTLIWLTVFLVCLASVCTVKGSTPKPTVKTKSTHAYTSSSSGKGTNTTVIPTAAHTTPHTGTKPPEDGHTSAPDKPTNASSNMHTSTNTTTKLPTTTPTTTTTTPTTTPTTTTTTPITTPTTTTTTPTTTTKTTTTTPPTTNPTTTTTTPTTTPTTTTTTPTTTPTTTTTTPTTTTKTTTTTPPTTTPTTTTTPPTTSNPTTTTTTTTTTTPTTTTTTTTPTTTTTSTSTIPTTTPTVPSTEISTVSNGGATSAVEVEATTAGGSTESPQTTTETTPTTTELDNCAGGEKCKHNGTCESTPDNYTCTCTPGWQGWSCDEVKDYCEPVPCKNNGICTQNLTLSPDYFSCECINGITGSTCEADVHECDNATICGNGICVEIFGSYGCECFDGWNGSYCESDVDECRSLPNVCPTNYRCNNTGGGYDCICDDPLEYIDNLCQKPHVLWPDFKSGSEFTRQTVYEVKTAIPFPYYESASRDLFVFKYGYVAFGGNILSSHAPFVPSQWPYSTKLFGVYWADIEATNSSTNPSHFYLSLDEGRLRNLTHMSTLIKYVKDAISDSQFQPLSVLAATWVNAVPSPAKKFPSDKATFQVIIATDGQVTYAISGYRTVWANTNVFDRPFVQTAHSLHNGAQSNETSPSNETGPVVVKLVAETVVNTGSLACVYETQHSIDYFGDELQSLPPCPCYQAQAVNDDRFDAASGLPACYQSVISSPGNKLYQLCCFDEHGFLLNFTRDALTPLSVSTRDIYLKSAQYSCCVDGSWQCDWFYSQLSLPGCSEYVPPSVGGGFGDPHIVTFDGNKYSFNDLGDFVLFRSGDVEFQGRTNISSSGKTAVFVAYALKDVNDTYRFYQDNGNVLYSNGATSTSVPEAKVPTSKFIVKVRSKNSALSYQITLLSHNYPDTLGLLGSFDRNASNDFKFQNGKLTEGKAEQLTADIINQFAESWKVENSLFGDNLTYANFTAPDLATAPDQVLLQIYEHRNLSGYYEAKGICGDELFCLQDYLVEGDPESAKDTLEEATDIYNHQNISNELPTFQNTQHYFQVNVSHLLNLTLTATTHSNATFSVSGDLSKLAGFKLDGDQVTWNISADLGALRNASFPQDLVFYVTDAHNLSAEYAPLISLCLCRKPSQCSVEPATFDYNNSTNKYFLGSDGTTEGNVGSWICDCDGRAEGDFCEIEIDVCDNCFVKNKSLCNTTLEDYCPACPAGHEGNPFLCPDINECLTNNGGCSDICINTDGSFNCDCKKGYSLNTDDGKSCDDIDECLDPGYCNNSEKFCVNDKGSAHCSCYPGLVGNEKCIRAPFVFYGSLGLRAYKDQAMSYALLVKSSPEFIALAEKVSTAITDLLVNSSLLTSSELYVEVLSFENATATIITNRAKRDTNSHIEAYTVVNFLIHSTNSSVDFYAIKGALASGLKGCDENCKLGQLLLFSDKNPALDDKDLCTHEEVHHCDLSTTECQADKYYHHFTQCICKKGYKKFEMNFFSCYDVDECADNGTLLCGSRKGACINLPGSYQCDCAKGQVWNNSTRACVGDKCSKNPCENDGACFISNNEQGFVCSCTYGWNGPVCADEDTDARRMKIAVICVGAILGFCCLALFIILVVVCVRQRRNAKETSLNDGYSVIKPATHRNSNEMEENGRGNVYSRPSFEGSSNKRTSFNSSESKKEGNSNTYYNKAFDNDVVARL